MCSRFLRVFATTASVVLFSMSTAPIHAARLMPTHRLGILDGGRPVVPGVLVTAMAFSHAATYAAGRYEVPDPSGATGYSPAGSVWLISHNGGATWQTHGDHSSLLQIVQSESNGNVSWPNHALLPSNFTVTSIAIDPHNPRVVYVTGCTNNDVTCFGSTRGQVILRSTNGGQSWSEILVFHAPVDPAGQQELTAAQITTNIDKTPALLRAVRRVGGIPDQGLAVAVDPANSNNLYARLSGLGMVTSTNGGRTWAYAAQAIAYGVGSTILIDPTSPLQHRLIYVVQRDGALYLSRDSGKHWTERTQVGQKPAFGGFRSPVLQGHTLFVTTDHGVWITNDQGLSFHPYAGNPFRGAFMDESIYGGTTWLASVNGPNAGPGDGLYAFTRRNKWRLVAATEARRYRDVGSVDLSSHDPDVTRLWENPSTRTVFSAGQAGGLFRWSARP